MTGEEICSLALCEVAHAIAKKIVSACEVTEACLARIERLQPAYNAFITIDADAALAAAARSDNAIARDDDIGPLHGVPLAHKDTFYRAGRRATCGSRLRRDFVPDHTAMVLSRLDAAGAIDLGGLNTSDSGCNAFGLNVLVGRAKNPWIPAHTTGGSSSGSGTAVAARLVFGSFGSDSGGSVRLPAAMCGVTGLLPTSGRISRHGIMPLSFTLDTPGPIARTAADIARLLRASAGHDPRDVGTSAEPVPDYEASLDGPVAGWRLGVPRNYFRDGMGPDVARPVDRSLATFRDLGVEIVELDVPDPGPLEAYGNVIVFAEGARVHRRALRDHALDYTPVTRGAMEFGLTIPATLYIEALSYRARALADFLETVFDKVDALHTPLMPKSVPDMADVEATLAREETLPWDVSRNTKPFSYLGLPALSLPCGFDDRGLPVAFQLVARPFAEKRLLRLGYAFQQATTFHSIVPME